MTLLDRRPGTPSNDGTGSDAQRAGTASTAPLSWADRARAHGLRAVAAPTDAASAAPSPARLELQRWVDGIAALAQPDEVVWCDGSPAERHRLTRQLVDEGKLIRLNGEWRPGSYLARSEPGDVARLESRTFICSADPADAGPTNNWAEPVAMREELRAVFAGSVRGRTLYVVPFSMGPVGGRLSKLGVQLTDSPYVVLSMGVMTRMGEAALGLIDAGEPWVRCIHSVGFPLVDADGARRDDTTWPCNELKYVSHFPEDREIWSYGSGYGGNALLGKKSFALRIASVIARDEGWLAEHMLVIKVTSPAGRVFHLAAAFPSACGKTNLAMLRSTLPGWTVETIGDDIAWLRRGDDGRLWAINPEAGFFGVAPGTGEATNPNAMETIWGNTIFTNVALTDDGDVWWEGMTATAPKHLVDWRGEDWTPASGRPAAHPNARFTVSAAQCPSIAADWEAQDGVPIDAIVFGGRRRSNIPLVAEARDWSHGVFMGATISSEQTAAAEGPVGQLRRDPFAMLPFCGYNMADYWAHWLEVGADPALDAPRVFTVNWFRQDEDGRYLWPGFGDNIRAIEWICRRIDGEVGAVDSAAGLLPHPADLDLDGLSLAPGALDRLFEVDAEAWRAEAELTERFFDGFGDRVPPALRTELSALRDRLPRH